MAARRWKAVRADGAGAQPASPTPISAATPLAAAPPRPTVAGAVAIVGGGLSGLACGFALRRRGIKAVVFDTGKRGAGGRCSSRALNIGGGRQHVVDHAVQAFTAQGYPEVTELVAEMERAGAVRRWEGSVGTLRPDGKFQAREASEGPLYIGSRQRGALSIAEWLAEGQEVVKDVWVAKLNRSPQGSWVLLNQRSKSVRDEPLSYVVMAHNGKCADRLINTAPDWTSAHAPLKCKFTPKPSATSDKLELSSLWVCVVEVPKGTVRFDGAFIEGDEVLSWAGNNSSKYPQAGAEGPEAWTLVSTPAYGTANKCPQEAIPDAHWWKVSEAMTGAFGKLVRTSPKSWKVLHLQLWGAALPLNVCQQHFIHDADARVGVCGDWLTAPSVEGALFSGLALAEAISRELGGGLPTTGVRKFLGQSGHAIGAFGAGPGTRAVEAVTGAAGASAATSFQPSRRWGADASEKGVGKGKGKGKGKHEGKDEQQRKGSDTEGAARSAKGAGKGAKNGSGKPSGDLRGDTEGAKWYFGFGANISPWKLREKRKIAPIEESPGSLHGWRLMFNHKGAMGNIEPLVATDNGPESVHGMLLLLTPRDFDKLAKMEHEYVTSEVLVDTYDGRKIKALAFTSPPEWRLQGSLPPTERYLKLIREGATEVGLDSEYVLWLRSLPSVKGERGPEYWAVSGESAHQAKGDTRTVRSQGDSEGGSGRMLLEGVAACHAGGQLVDIGANLGKCSPADLAYQLSRSAAARVDRLILTGCSVKSSQVAQRICREWSGADGLQRAQAELGAAARKELGSFGLQALAGLTFTAGVHPHDAKTCNRETIAVLTGLSQDPRCVAIGECGLDYDRMFSPQAVQLEWFRKQAQLAATLGKPLFLHERDRDAAKGRPLGSASELQQILQEVGVEPSRVCVHCFTGSGADLKAYVDRGYFIGLTGFAAMRKRGAHLRTLLEEGKLPLGQLMLETDCPFMMPDKEFLDEAVGLQGRRMEPCALPAVCRAVAACYGVSAEEVARVTTANAVRFFSL